MGMLSLVWEKDLTFRAGPDQPALRMASSDADLLSPMQLLAHALMGCMAMDVVHILQKGRHDLKGLAVRFDGERAAEAPKRYTKVHLTFHVTGPVPADAVERAIALSKEKYCSVSNSLARDLEFTTSIELAG
jgi:putative redox protein